MSDNEFFHTLPCVENLRDAVEDRFGQKVVHLELFKFSSCSVVYKINLKGANGKTNPIVARSTPQNPYWGTSLSKPQLESEIYSADLLRKNNIPTPKVLLDGQILNIRGIGKDAYLPFFFMEFVEGEAGDRILLETKDPVKINRLLKKIALIFAKIHNVKGEEFGLISSIGKTIDGNSNFQDYFAKLIKTKHAFLQKNNITASFDEIELKCNSALVLAQKEGYQFNPTLGLYDLGGGNMLIDDENINVLDLSTCGWYETIMDFCGFYFSLGSFMDRKLDKDITADDLFKKYYTEFGGSLPDERIFDSLIKVFLYNELISFAIYSANHRSKLKNDKYPNILKNALEIWSVDNKSMFKFLDAI